MISFSAQCFQVCVFKSKTVASRAEGRHKAWQKCGCLQEAELLFRLRSSPQEHIVSQLERDL